MTTTWTPTWRAADLEPGLTAWLAQPHGLPHAQSLVGLEISRTHPDYPRYRWMMDRASAEHWWVQTPSLDDGTSADYLGRRP